MFFKKSGKKKYSEDDLKLPIDIVKFLKQGKQLEYEPSKSDVGIVKLQNFEELKLGEVCVIPSEDHEIWKKLPKNAKYAYYQVKIVDLVEEISGDYHPEGILIWLPEYEMFGNWDMEHLVITVFPKVSWPDIIKEPIKYLEGQWNLYDYGDIEILKPRRNTEFKFGDPFHSIGYESLVAVKKKQTLDEKRSEQRIKADRRKRKEEARKWKEEREQSYIVNTIVFKSKANEIHSFYFKDNFIYIKDLVSLIFRGPTTDDYIHEDWNVEQYVILLKDRKEKIHFQYIVTKNLLKESLSSQAGYPIEDIEEVIHYSSFLFRKIFRSNKVYLIKIRSPRGYDYEMHEVEDNNFIQELKKYNSNILFKER